MGGPERPEAWPAFVGTWLALASLALVAVADVGAFVPWAAAAATVSTGVGAAAVWRPWRSSFPGLTCGGAFAGAVLLVATILVAPGSENVVGGRDPGVYAATGLALAQHRGLLFEDPALRRLGGELNSESSNDWLFRSIHQHALRFPGQFFVRDLHAGVVEPGFLPVVPAWMALAARLGGLEWLLHVSGAFGVIALAYTMLAARASFRGGWLIAGGLLAISFPQLWWAREPMAESALGAFAWIAAWAAARWWDGAGWRWSLMAALGLRPPS